MGLAGERFDAAVVGAGIIGLAHAYALARSGRSVVVVERSPRAQGASVRNFGMIWPSRQPAGDRLQLALRSREIWAQVTREAGLWCDHSGSLYVAYDEDEARVLQEFTEAAQAGGDLSKRLIEPDEVVRIAPRIRLSGLLCGLHSTSELGVDPREALAELPGWLARAHGVQFRFGCQAAGYDGQQLQTSQGPISADQLFVCSGQDLQTLYPEALGGAGLVLCKLQMLRATVDAAEPWVGPMLASGLTLRYYEAFRDCPSLPALCERLDREVPELGRLGVHILVSRTRQGELTLGDSHEYGDAIDPFDKSLIDDLIMNRLEKFVDLRGVTINSRWHGLYVKHPSEPYVVLKPAPGVVAVTGLGGAGMTLSFGLAERVVREATGLAGVRS